MPVFKITRVLTLVDSVEVEAASEDEASFAARRAENLDWRRIAERSAFDATPLREGATAVPKNIPRGFGFYLRRIPNSQSEANALVSRLKEARARWVAFMVEDNEGNIQPLAAMKTYTEALKRAGVRYWFWTFPGEKRAASLSASADAAKLAVQTCEELGGEGVMLDVEAAYKGHPKELEALVDAALKATEKSRISVGFVSYPIPAYHSDIDWAQGSKCDWGSPMLYDTAKSDDLVRKSKEQYEALGFVGSKFVPSLATYDTESPGTGAQQLTGDLGRVLGADAKEQAAIFWSESSTDPSERAAILACAVTLGW